MSTVGKNIEILFKIIPEKKGDYVFKPFMAQGKIIKEVKPLYDGQFPLFIELDNTINGKGIDLKKYENVKYLFVVVNEKDIFLSSNQVFCSCGYVANEGKFFDEMKQISLADGMITLTAQIKLKS